MREVDIICEQIQRMRTRHVEPSTVSLSGEAYQRLKKPKKICGIPVDCDSTMSGGWCVR